MQDTNAFDVQELLSRLVSGDEAATRQFVTEYEPFIRRAIRSRLSRAHLRAIADSADVCQSVLGSFLLRLTAGEFDVCSREHLEKLLFSIARKKFAMLARREYAQRRDRRRNKPLWFEDDPPDRCPDLPETLIETQDLLEAVRTRLPADEAAWFGLRQQGKSWEEIAVVVGETSVVLRKRLSRALQRVAVELGLEVSRV